MDRRDISKFLLGSVAGTGLIAQSAHAQSCTPCHPGDVTAYGAVAGGSAATNRAAFQAALDANSEIYVPPGTFDVNATVFFNTNQTLRFASREAVIHATFSGPILRGKNANSQSIEGVTIFSGTITGLGSASGGSIGLDLTSTRMCKVFGLQITDVERGILCTFDYSGSYYNEFHGVDIQRAYNGIKNSTLGNDNKMFGGRISEVTHGTWDENCTGNSYFGVAIEHFTGAAHRAGISDPCSYIRWVNSRIENLTTSAPYASAIGFELGSGVATALGGRIDSPQIVLTAVPYQFHANTNDTNVIADVRWQIAGGTPISKHQRVTQALDFPLIAANSTAELAVTISGALATDSIFVTAPSTLAAGLMCSTRPGSGQHYVRIANVTGAAINPASATFTIDIWRH